MAGRGGVQLLSFFLFFLLLSSSSLLVSSADFFSDAPTFETLFQFGKNAYTLGGWHECIAFMRRAIEDFEYYESELLSCVGRCERRVPSASLSSPHSSTLSFLYSSATLSLCLLRCRRDRLTERRPPLDDPHVLDAFLERQPYRYLELCYWKEGYLEKAVASAYTFLVANPGHKDSIANLNFYMQHSAYSETMLKDLGKPDYEHHFVAGVEAYTAGEWAKCIYNFEQTLDEFWKADDRCRRVCRHRIDWAGLTADADIDTAVSSLWGSVLVCQHECLGRLSFVNGRDVGHLPARVYEYIHICFYQERRGSEATRAIANFLLFDDAPSMRWNRREYARLYAETATEQQLFQPDIKALERAKQRIIERRVFDFFRNRLAPVNEEFPPEQADDYKTLDESVDLSDKFEYDLTERLLDNELCRLFRSPLPQPGLSAATREVVARARSLFGLGEARASCGEAGRAPPCAHGAVFSVEKESCGKWQGSGHLSGCVLVFCPHHNSKHQH